MAEPCKVFRIEQSAAARLEPNVETAQSALRHAAILRELATLRAAIGAATPPRARPGAASAGGESSRLSNELTLIAGAIRGGESGGESSAQAAAPMSRIDHELNAVVSGTEAATQKILAAAEEIDSTANTLSAALKGRLEQDLAQDIQDQVIAIFEACNFQDLIGQRVAKVLAAVKFVEDHIARVLEEIKTASAAAEALHGPRLDGDRGHASQDDVDAIFAKRRMASGE
jgi:chemotaxis protein CheZ